MPPAYLSPWRWNRDANLLCCRLSRSWLRSSLTAATVGLLTPLVMLGLLVELVKWNITSLPWPPRSSDSAEHLAHYHRSSVGTCRQLLGGPPTSQSL